jgi:hypothetical protein
MKNLDGARDPGRVGLGFAITPRWGSDRRERTPRVQQKNVGHAQLNQAGSSCRLPSSHQEGRRRSRWGRKVITGFRSVGFTYG